MRPRKDVGVPREQLFVEIDTSTHHHSDVTSFKKKKTAMGVDRLCVLKQAVEE